MTLIKIISEEIGVNLLVLSISESLYQTRVVELELPLSFPSSYLSKIWGLNKYETEDRLNQLESECRPNRIIQSLTHKNMLKYIDTYEQLSQHYSDYIEFLGFKKRNRANIQERFNTIHPDFKLPEPNAIPFVNLKKTYFNEDEIKKILLGHENDMARLKLKIKQLEEQNDKNNAQKLPYLLIKQDN